MNGIIHVQCVPRQVQPIMIPIATINTVPTKLCPKPRTLESKPLFNQLQYAVLIEICIEKYVFPNRWSDNSSHTNIIRHIKAVMVHCLCSLTCGSLVPRCICCILPITFPKQKNRARLKNPASLQFSPKPEKMLRCILDTFLTCLGPTEHANPNKSSCVALNTCAAYR